ncbi:MAG: MFS transporter [Deltaproteobacteria bacterium]|nr:MFS transporter [Deltaproteobacteria bacterium]
MVSDHQLGTFRMQLIPILFLVSIEFMNVLSRAIFSPLLLTIEEDLYLSHAQASSFFMLISAGLSLSMFLSGFLSSKLIHRQVIVLSAVLCGLSLIAVSLSASLLAVRISLFSLGMGAGFYLPSGIATVSSLVVPRDLGKAMATHELGPTMGFVAGPILVGLLSKYASWRSMLVVIGVTNMLMAFLYAFFGRGGDFAGSKPNLRNLRSMFAHPNFWIMTAFFVVAVGGEQGVYALLPTYLVSDKGLESVSANTIFGLSRISVALTIVISGLFVDRFGVKRSMFFIVMSSGILTALVGLTSGISLLLVIFLQPVIVGCFFPAGLAALSRIGSKHFTNIIVSMIIPISILLGGGVVPSLLGILGEHGGFPIGFVFLGTSMLLSTVLFLFLKL